MCVCLTVCDDVRLEVCVCTSDHLFAPSHLRLCSASARAFDGVYVCVCACVRPCGGVFVCACVSSHVCSCVCARMCL